MRILVVDDDPINRFLLINMLEQQGYVDTYEAEDGRVAIELAKQIQPDLVLLDVVMPEIDGYEAAPILKRISGDIYLPIIFITALEDQTELARCLEVGGDDFVAKPFDKVILSAKIRAHSRTRILSQRAFEQNKQLSFYQSAVEREHRIVEHIFANALAIDDSLTSYIDYSLNPATTFNGDLFLMSTSPSGGMYFLLGDFTGHGLASSIGALPVSQGFNAMSKKGLSLMEMAETLNKTLLLLLPDDMFFAAIIVEVDASGQRIDVWNGGMPSLILQNADGEVIKHFYSRHMSLGILEPEDFAVTVERHQADYGDRLTCFSDGLVEIVNTEDVMLGDQGLENWLIAEPSISSKKIVEKAYEYLGSTESLDDLTIASYICQPLRGVNQDQSLSSIPLKLVNQLSADEIKTSEPISVLVNVLANQLSMFSFHSAFFTAFSELYNNALDHGILRLDSSLKDTEDGFFDYFNHRMEKLEALQEASIVITTEFKPKERRLYFQIKDSGQGFDDSQLSDIQDMEQSYGRGIPLVKALCESLEYSEGGTKVNAVFAL